MPELAYQSRRTSVCWHRCARDFSNLFELAYIPAQPHQPVALGWRQYAVRETTEFGFEVRIGHRSAEAANCVLDIFLDGLAVLQLDGNMCLIFLHSLVDDRAHAIA